MDLGQKQEMLHFFGLQINAVFFGPVKKPVGNINCGDGCRNCLFLSFQNIRYFTVTLHLTVFFPAFTVITAVPFFFAVILPLESTFTTLEELDL